MNHLIANRIITPDGTVLQSFSVHDYKEYTDKNGLVYMVDGGLSYLRRNVHDDAPFIEASVYDNDLHVIIREAFHWGSYGKGGDQPLKRLALSTMSDDHIKAILETQHHIPPHIRQVFEDEQDFRAANDITIKDAE